MRNVANTKSVAETLDETGLPWEIIRARKHRKVYLAGRLVGVLPGNPGRSETGRDLMNLKSQIRRLAKELA